MAFWGIEVKPGKPFTHVYDGLKGRLHISMATLGTGTATKKSILQCNIGNRSPVYLCSLYPDTAESLQLNLEFEEADEVIFSVLGPRSVHLSGYYLDGRRHHNPDDSESFGEDIADSETHRSVDSEEDKYDDSFIDDSDPEVFLPSPIYDGGDSDAGYVEELSDKKKPENGKGHRRRLRKKYVLSESEVESEDEDRLPISSLVKTQATMKDTTQEVEEKVEKIAVDTSNKKTEDDVCNAAESIRDADDVDVDGQSKRQVDQPEDPLMPNVGPENGGTPKRKRKEHPKKEKELQSNVLKKEDEAQKDEARADNRTQNFCGEEGGQEQKMANHKSGAEVPDTSSMPCTELALENCERPKKKRKKVEGKTFEVVSTNHGNVVKEDEGQQDEAKVDMCPDLPARSEQNQNSAKDEFVSQSIEKKVKKKKKSKTHAHGEAINTDVPLLSAEEKITSPIQIEALNADAKSSHVRTLPNGLSIEELEAGKPDGKVATSGKKISVHYVGKLKENGKVIDSNVGSAPHKFRLGSGKVIGGWDVGLDGMRVGDKRRLLVPPSMGYGSEGDGKDVPPNSWLVYDVELVKVR